MPDDRDEYARQIAAEANAPESVQNSTGSFSDSPLGKVTGAIGNAWQAAKDYTKDDLLLGENGVLGLRTPRARSYEDMQRNVNAQNAALETGHAAAPAAAPPPVSVAAPEVPPGVVRAIPQQATRPAPMAGAQGPNFAPMGATYDVQLAAQRDATRAGVTANEAQATGAAMVGDQQRRDAEAMQARAQEQAQQTQRQLDEVHRLSEEAASKQIDPSRWWHNQDGASKVLYTLSAALGGFAAGWTHGPNQAMAQINRYIDDDIGAQKTAIEQAHGRVTDAKGVLGEMVQRFGNLNQAEAATRILHYDAMANDLKAQVASAQSPAVDANGRILEAEIQRKKLEEQQRFAMAKSLAQPALGKLSEEYGKAGIPEAQQAIDRVKDIAGQSDPAGFGLFARTAHSLGADWMIPQEGLNNRAAVDQAVLKIAHATGRVTPQEIEAVRHGYLGAVENPAALKQFVSGVQAEIDAKRSNIQAGADPRAVEAQGALNDAYRRRSGSAPKAGLPPGSTP